MKKFNAFEWLLICLILATFITGIFFASGQHDDAVVNLAPTLPSVTICR